ncbi:unnamed protein product [Adineta ricciae]|uniref:Uncharacterized protein n=1 Tax=Adineta ricciae TaxID=249248 RepID=A0A815TQN1_ADIRI|nr:unnamed protein product [Adineta ricciae]
MAFKIGNFETKNTYSMTVGGDAKHINVHIADGALKANHTPVQAAMNSAGNAASKIIESGASLITAPVTWFKDMQENWLSYMIVIAIIIGGATQSQLIELTKIIGEKIIPTPQRPPSSAISPLNFPYLARNSQV